MRFLMKEVFSNANLQYHPEELIKYHWRYQAFHSIHTEDESQGRKCLVLLCFDLFEPKLSPESRLLHKFIQHFRDSIVSTPPIDRNFLHATLLEVVSKTFDEALWTFRVPVRSMEKANDSFIEQLWRSSTATFAPTSLIQDGNASSRKPTAIVTARGPLQLETGQHQNRQRPGHLTKTMSVDELEAKQQRKRLSTETGRSEARYRYIHDLTRHVVHMVECLSVGMNTMRSMIQELERHGVEAEDQAVKRRNLKYAGRLGFYRLMLENLQLRAKAFEARLHSESRMASHIAEERAAQTSRAILDQSQRLLSRAHNDGRELTQFVGALSILFLPPTFTSSFFGMNFFLDLTLREIWIFFVLTIPLLIMAAWAWQNIGRIMKWWTRVQGRGTPKQDNVSEEIEI